jgi:hypothetical protein
MGCPSCLWIKRLSGVLEDLGLQSAIDLVGVAFEDFLLVGIAARALST